MPRRYRHNSSMRSKRRVVGACEESSPTASSHQTQIPRAAFSSKVNFDISECNSQHASPLCSKIPPEIRNTIFNLVVVQEDDLSRPYPTGAFYCRPGYRGPRHMNTQLLRTCRKFYLETRTLPSTQYKTLTICGGDPERAPPGVIVDPGTYLRKNEFSRLFPAKICAGHVRVFAQMYWLEHGNLQARWSGRNNYINFCPKKLSIVIRHTDWWDWESDAHLRIDKNLFADYECPNSVEEIEMEFETVERKKYQLDGILYLFVKHWKFRRLDGSELLTDPQTFRVSRWVGNPCINGSYHSEQKGSTTLPYYVVTVTWRLPDMTYKSMAEDFSKITWPWSEPSNDVLSKCIP